MSTADVKKQVLPADSSQRIDFATQPSAYKHWKLSLEGRVATLALDVDEQPALLAVNERLRDDFVADSQRGVARWNRAIQQYGIDFELTLPHRGFNRRIGTFAGNRVSMRRQDHQRRPVGAAVARLATHRSGPRLRKILDETGSAARYDGELDCSARQGHR